MADILAAFIIPVIIILSFCYLLIRISMMVRRKGGAFTHIVFGANQEFFDRHQRKAIEVIVNKNANKKEEEEESGEDY